MQKILMALALILFQGLNCSASSDEYEEEDVPSRHVQRLTLAEKKFRDQQQYQAATLRAQEDATRTKQAVLKDTQAYHRATLLAKEEEAKIKKAQLKAAQEERELQRFELEIRARELAVKEAEEARLHAAKTAKPHHPPVATKAKAVVDTSWQQDLAEAKDFLAQWATQPANRCDAFMQEMIGQYKKRTPLSEEAVNQLLERRDIIRKALSLGQTKLKTGAYKGIPGAEQNILTALTYGDVGLTYASAKGIVADEISLPKQTRAKTQKL